jgi:hypothetical protein
MIALVALAGVARGQMTEAVKAREVFNALYGADLDRVRRTGEWSDDLDLARRMVDAARAQAADQPEFLTVLCDTVYDLSAERKPDGRPIAEQAMLLEMQNVPERYGDALEKLLNVRRWRYWYDVPVGERPALADELIDTYLAVAEMELPKGKDVAWLCNDVKRIANETNSWRTAEVVTKADALIQAGRNQVDLATMKNRVVSSPGDTAARSSLVMMYLVNEDNPVAAGAYLAGDSPSTLRRYVPEAARAVSTVEPAMCLELGDWYKTLAFGASPLAKPAMLDRANSYYQRFLDNHKAQDPDRARAEAGLAAVNAELDRINFVFAQVPAVSAFAPGVWVDVLKATDPLKYRCKGEWKRAGNGISVDPISGGRLMLPVVPDGSYELQANFVRTKGNESIGLFLPLGGHTALLRLSRDGQASGLELLKGKRANENITTVHPGLLENDRVYTVTASVTRGPQRVRIYVELNGRPYIRWEGSPADFSLLPGLDMPNRDAPGLFAYDSAVTFRSVRLRMISGMGKVLR